MPLVVIYMDGKNITQSQIISFAIMWVILGIGVYLFNQILVFQSVHFQTQRSLTIVECVYLMSQIITTVGYGDIPQQIRQGRFLWPSTSFLRS